MSKVLLLKLGDLKRANAIALKDALSELAPLLGLFYGLWYDREYLLTHIYPILMISKYFNPYTDFGFKKLFGEEGSKDLLMV